MKGEESEVGAIDSPHYSGGHLCLLALSRPFVALNGHKDI